MFPILFLIFVGKLLEICNDSVKHASAVGFVNNINILVYGPDSGLNCLKLKEIHWKCLEWAERHGAKFALQKYELMHFAPGKKKIWTGATLNLDGVKVKPAASARILGVQVNSGLK